jgi:hypothetical protein
VRRTHSHRKLRHCTCISIPGWNTNHSGSQLRIPGQIPLQLHVQGLSRDNKADLQFKGNQKLQTRFRLCLRKLFRCCARDTRSLFFSARSLSWQRCTPHCFSTDVSCRVTLLSTDRLASVSQPRFLSFTRTSPRPAGSALPITHIPEHSYITYPSWAPKQASSLLPTASCSRRKTGPIRKR